MVELAPESTGVKLVLDRLVEALADAVRLRMLGLGTRVLDVLQIQIQHVFVRFPITAVLAAAIGQDAQQRYPTRVASILIAA